MAASTSRRGLGSRLRARAGVAALAAALAVGGQVGAGAPARADQCPCSVFPSSSTPGTADSGDPYSVVVGVKVTPSDNGRIDGVRFYKASTNGGVHTGSLWTSDGKLLATGTFVNETASGWQTLMFADPVPVREGATYVASYYAPGGHYSYDVGYFLNGPAGQAPITAPADGASGGNGVYTYDGASAFPNLSHNDANYWVDVVYDNAGVPTSAPTVKSTTPAGGASGVTATASVNATFSAPVDPSTMRFSLTDASGAQVPGAVSYNADGTAATFTPGTQLPSRTVFTASVQASDAWGNAMDDPATWKFTTDSTAPAYTCPCSLFDSGSGSGSGTTPEVPDSNDPNSVELGMRFTPAVNGTVTGIRFYKGATNTGVHTGTLWNSSTETSLATGTFSNETADGWQTMTFSTPVAVTAGVVYVASYHAPAGKYAYTTGYFSYPRQSYPLTALASTSSQGNGTYGYGSSPTFPGDSGDGTNYWVDVVFTAS
ncbi:hypothetical protein ABIA35_004978 [Catenulispora sp. MAP12-49]|uniref:DUF4082 domain-containing protein n=1 Tax=unclassified Catenulispora TaxID=414885 RepID=UPI00351361D7